VSKPKEKYPVSEYNRVELGMRFKHHAPHGDQSERYEACRARALAFALWIERNMPHSREKALAVTKIEEAMFWANAAIARREYRPAEPCETGRKPDRKPKKKT
jgi:hypothetical protein